MSVNMSGSGTLGLGVGVGSYQPGGIRASQGTFSSFLCFFNKFDVSKGKKKSLKYFVYKHVLQHGWPFWNILSL